MAGAGQTNEAISSRVSGIAFVLIPGGAGAFGGNHGRPEWSQGRTSFSESGAFDGFLLALQHESADAFGRFLNVQRRKLEHALGIERGILVANAQTALGDLADAAPFAIRHGEDVAHHFLGAGIAGWIWGYGPHGSPPVLQVLAFALAMFVLQDASALASTVPMTAELRPEALHGWLWRSAVALLVAAVLIAVVYGVRALVNFHTSYPLEVGGLFGVIAVLAAGAWLFSRSLR